MAVFAQPADTDQEDSALDLAGEPVGAQAEPDSNERRLPIAHAVRIDLVLHSLHGIVDVLAGHDLCIDLPDLLKLISVPGERLVHRQRLAVLEVQPFRLALLEAFNDSACQADVLPVREDRACSVEVLGVVKLCVFGEHLISAVHGLAAVLAARNILDDLGDLGCCGTYRFR